MCGKDSAKSRAHWCEVYLSTKAVSARDGGFHREMGTKAKGPVTSADALNLESLAIPSPVERAPWGGTELCCPTFPTVKSLVWAITDAADKSFPALFVDMVTL